MFCQRLTPCGALLPSGSNGRKIHPKSKIKMAIPSFKYFEDEKSATHQSHVVCCTQLICFFIPLRVCKVSFVQLNIYQINYQGANSINSPLHPKKCFQVHLHVILLPLMRNTCLLGAKVKRVQHQMITAFLSTALGIVCIRGLPRFLTFTFQMLHSTPFNTKGPKNLKLC